MTLFEIKELLGNRYYSAINPQSSFKKILTCDYGEAEMIIELVETINKDGEDNWIITDSYCNLRRKVRKKQDYKCLDEAIELLDFDIQMLERNGVKIA